MDERQIAVVMAKVRVGAVKILDGHPDYYGVPNHTVPRAVRGSLVESMVGLVEDAIREGLGE